MAITVIGAGLAGCEAAYAAAQRGEAVTLWEMKPDCYTPAHHQPLFAELVCSNSLKASRLESAAGLLKEEMVRLGSLTVPVARACAVPAGGALAVDRDAFSSGVTERIRSHPLITVRQGEVTHLPEDGVVVVATGPLTSPALAEEIAALCGGGLSFYDAAAPIVTADSVDMTSAFRASRYDREESGEGDYINCPLNKEEYEAFREALVGAERAPLHAFDTPTDMKVYEGCMPIEVLATRGHDAMRFGPMKPVGLRDPHTGHRPWAVVQLRTENVAGTLYNLVGFQTNLKFAEQRRVFGMIPALRHAEFMRYGVMHRNTFLNAPALLDAAFRFKSRPTLFFAGQMTGVEGYMESAASGILAGINAVRQVRGQRMLVLPDDTMMGALAQHVSQPNDHYQPMGANFGILPPLETPIRDKKQRYAALARRALDSLEERMKQYEDHR
ncbi:MAG: methylenetetrahydrofolate--tRNA-(uracil(54)-C(5))-methyltransferase (FADH(2)-oxidizing) TrmFO [Ruminococcaceae bacterium]|nr:methylenetetrahydrofolate--tRNA-(uracil(54)-C(5))-methyltransferase (FADH(2)-oxidizing) TrmFO [Oscillospiraceae bacterium]